MSSVLIRTSAVPYHHQWHSGIKCTYRKFADDKKLSGVVEMPGRWDAIQRDLEKLNKWIHVNLIRFNSAKCEVLNLSQGNSQL